MLQRFTRIVTSAVVFGFFMGCNCSENTSTNYEQLNVLLITADDLNYNSVGVYGCTVPNITPNIDKLAGQGMMFTNGYVNIAVCQPSRQSVMTGRYPHRNGAMGFEPIDNDVPTLQEELNKVGYINGVIGKEEHMKPMAKFCWDFCIREEDVASGMGIGRDPELYYKYTAEFLAKSKKENKPFFLNANTHDPHRPFAGSESEKKYWGKDLPVFSRQILPEEVEVPGFLPDIPEVRKEIAEYYTSVYRCDEVVGAILKALEESGMADNTIVMFLSDNGIAVPFAKSNCYLNSVKTPWIIRWPGQVPAGAVDSTHVISGIDYMPTILHALHLSKTPGMDGYSFLPVLQGKKQDSRNVVFTQFHKIFSGREFPMRGIKGDRYGYIVNFWSDGKFGIKGDALGGRSYEAMAEAAKTDSTLAKRMDLYIYRVEEELYDFKNDPDALVNLINKPDLNDKKMHLKKLLFREMKRSKDPLTEEFEQRFMNL